MKYTPTKTFSIIVGAGLLALSITASDLLVSSARGASDILTIEAVLHDEMALTGAHDIEVLDGLAYIAGKGFTSRALPSNGKYPYEKSKGGSIAIVDVKKPAAPKLLWSANTPLDYEDAETVMPLGGNRLLIGTREALLFDVGQPGRPKLLARLKDRPQIDMINGFARFGDVVFGANKMGHIFALNIVLPSELKLLGARNTEALDGFAKPHDVAPSGDLLVVVSPEDFGRTGKPGRVGVYRVTDSVTGRVMPAKRWTLLGRIDDKRLAGANRVMTNGSFAYVGSSLSPVPGRADGLRAMISIIDLSDPAKPRLRGSIEFPDPRSRGPNGLEVAGTVVFAAGGQTVQAIDVSNPDNPRELTYFTSAEVFPGGQDDAHDLVYHDGHLFVTAQNSHSLVVLKVGTERARSIRP